MHALGRGRFSKWGLVSASSSASLSCACSTGMAQTGACAEPRPVCGIPALLTPVGGVWPCACSEGCDALDDAANLSMAECPCHPFLSIPPCLQMGHCCTPRPPCQGSVDVLATTPVPCPLHGRRPRLLRSPITGLVYLLQQVPAVAASNSRILSCMLGSHVRQAPVQRSKEAAPDVANLGDRQF